MNLRKQELEEAKERYVDEVFIDDGSELALITVNAIEQGIVPSLVNQVKEMLGGYLGLVYEMYFEEKEVAGTC